MIRTSLLILTLSAFGASTAAAQGLPFGTIDDFTTSTQTCIGIVLKEQQPDTLLPDSDWSKSTRQTTYQGRARTSVSAKSQKVNLSVVYDLESSCQVLGDVEVQLAGGQYDAPQTIGTLVMRLRDQIDSRFAVRGMKAGALDNPIIITDAFDVEITPLTSTSEARVTFIISVRSSKNDGQTQGGSIQ